MNVKVYLKSGKVLELSDVEPVHDADGHAKNILTLHRESQTVLLMVDQVEALVVDASGESDPEFQKWPELIRDRFGNRTNGGR